MFTTTSSTDFNLVTAHIVKQISEEQPQQQKKPTPSRAAWHISAIQGWTVFLTSRGSRVDSHTRMIPLTKTLRNASKETGLSLQASSEQWVYCKSETKRIAFLKNGALDKRSRKTLGNLDPAEWICEECAPRRWFCNTYLEWHIFLLLTLYSLQMGDSGRKKFSISRRYTVL